jgi:hypothetical protein
MSILSYLQSTRAIRYGHNIVTRFLATRAGTWARVVIVGAAAELVGQAQRLLAGQAVRCVPVHFHLCSADVPQGERRVREFPT